MRRKRKICFLRIQTRSDCDEKSFPNLFLHSAAPQSFSGCFKIYFLFIHLNLLHKIYEITRKSFMKTFLVHSVSKVEIFPDYREIFPLKNFHSTSKSNYSLSLATRKRPKASNSLDQNTQSTFIKHR